MSSLHYFQRYSQKENVVTNNTLLLFSRLYAHSTLHFETFLANLMETDAPEVGVRFTQQEAGSKKSVPDGLLEQTSFKVVIETKLHSKPEQKQLVRHLESFGSEHRQVLLVLTPTQPSPNFRERLATAVRDYNDERGLRIAPVCTTFRQVIHSYRDALAAHDYEMHDVLTDYEDFCATFDKGQLLPREDYTMRAVPCGKTLEDNRDFGVYYQPVDRSYRDHKYIGIYKEKRVQYVGEIESIVVADLTEDGLRAAGQDSPLTSEQRDRIEKVALRAREQHGWDITSGHRFFLVKEFYPTNFHKGSPGGMMAHRYFDLGEVLDTERLPSIEEIAELLSGKTW